MKKLNIITALLPVYMGAARSTNAGCYSSCDSTSPIFSKEIFKSQSKGEFYKGYFTKNIPTVDACQENTINLVFFFNNEKIKPSSFTLLSRNSTYNEDNVFKTNPPVLSHTIQQKP